MKDFDREFNQNRQMFNLIFVLFWVFFFVLIGFGVYNYIASPRLTEDCIKRGGTVTTGALGVFEGCIIGPASVGVIKVK